MANFYYMDTDKNFNHENDSLFKKNTIKTSNNNLKVLNIAFCFDDNFVMPTGVAIASVIENNKDSHLHFHLFFESISEKNKSRILEIQGDNVSITTYELQEELSVNPNTLILGIPKSTCLRFMVPFILRHEVDSVLYLDGDMIFLDSLHALHDLNLKGHIAAVVADSKEMQQKASTLGYGIDTDKYFNAGFLFINVSEWNFKNVTAVAFNMINSGTIYKYADQDVLNILLNENIKLIDKKYNKTITLSPIDRVDDKASRGTTILHYVTKNKPWFMIFESQIFFYYLNQSPWKDTQLKLTPNASLLRIKAKKLLSDKKFFDWIKYFSLYIKYKLFSK